MIVTCKEMKAIEKKASENGISYYEMMENAGTACFNEIIKDNPRSAAIYCGKGNNGGDGFVIARLLKNHGVDVEIAIPDGKPVTEDAITNFNLISDIPISDSPKGEIIIDAIYGTGFHGKFRDDIAEIIADINSSGKKVFSVDIPSGLSGDMKDGDPICDIPVRATGTFALHSKKPVHICRSANEYTGKVITLSIGIEDVV